VCCILIATAMNGLFHFSFVFFGFMLLDYRYALACIKWSLARVGTTSSFILHQYYSWANIPVSEHCYFNYIPVKVVYAPCLELLLTMMGSLGVKY
jgi:hypothetical protein